jgi:hypothetical protein
MRSLAARACELEGRLAARPTRVVKAARSMTGGAQCKFASDARNECTGVVDCDVP